MDIVSAKKKLELATPEATTRDVSQPQKQELLVSPLHTALVLPLPTMRPYWRSFPISHVVAVGI
jgi:hypothetical protein